MVPMLTKSQEIIKVLPKQKGWDKIERKNILNNSKLHDGKLKQKHFRHIQLNFEVLNFEYFLFVDSKVIAHLLQNRQK